MKILTIVIADNHPISRAGLKLTLDTVPEFKIVGEAASGHQAIQICQKLRPDVVLMDINMPNGNGIEATQILHRQFPEMVIIGLSGFSHDEMQREIIQAGASGYISKETDISQMIELILKISYRKHQPTVSDTSEVFNLTHMEKKVLGLLAEGYDRQQIAEQLSISINTVKMHFRNLYHKLGVANAQEAIRIAVQHHLIH